MLEEILVKVDDVVIPRKRMRVANHIQDLANSIAENGLLHPITLRRDAGTLILVAGRRRLEAMKLLKEGQVRAQVIDADETKALLIEIDENLQRAELNELQRAQHIGERKRVWEALHPQTRHGGAPGKRGGRGGKASKDDNVASLPHPPAQPFIDETAKQTQTSSRTVSRYAQIDANLCRKAQELLDGTPIADKQKDLLQISRLDKQEQVAVAHRIHSGEAKSVAQAKRQIEAEKISAEPNPLPTGPFRVIVADPPWAYEKRKDDSTKRENITYKTMELDEIKSLSVKELAAEDSVLWLWTTNAHLPEAFGVAKAWGFTYKTMLTWDKGRMGMGDWLRGQTEHCLLCSKGSPSILLKDQTTIIREQRKGHSEKPEAFYLLVESLCVGSKVELFSRKSRKDWQAWGSQKV